MSYLLSVIVPIYNTEKYLRKCLDSIVSQTLKDIEIICVNDGSTDNSQMILEEYASKDKRIKIIVQENKGVVYSRNVGICTASAKYIGFVDSDDWIEPRMFEKLYEYMTDNDVDLVSSGYVLEGNYTSYVVDSIEEGVYSEDKFQDVRENFIFNFSKRDIGLRGSLCCKLFRKDILMSSMTRISDKVTMSEDKLLILSYLLDSSSGVVTKDCYYHYMINPKSVVHTSNSNYLVVVNEVYQNFLQLYNHENFSESMVLQSELYLTDLLVMGINSRLGFKNSNLLWIDPYYLEKIPPKSKIAVYGGGAMGRKYHRQLLHAGFEIPICVDFGFEKMNNDILNLKAPRDLLHSDFDYIIITIKNKLKASEIKEQLIKLGIKEEKILWFEQKELFWKYAEADGLI